MLDEYTLFWIAAAVQSFGIVTLLIARSGDVIAPPWLAWLLFYAAMLAVGACSACSLAIEGGGWLMSGVTLGVMAVGGTWEVRPPAESHSF